MIGYKQSQKILRVLGPRDLVQETPKKGTLSAQTPARGSGRQRRQGLKNLLRLSLTLKFEWCFRKNGGHLKPVTLKPVIRIFRIFRVFVSAFSAFSAFFFALQNLLRPLFFWGERDFPRFPRISFESLISKIRPTGFRMTGLTKLGDQKTIRAVLQNLHGSATFFFRSTSLILLHERKGLENHKK